MKTNKAALIILDGWGIGDGTKSDAIANAKTPFYNSLLATYPHGTLKTSGEDVGLPDGQMGNSEVGHLNIGAGRVVYQDLVKINLACRNNTIDTHPVLLETIDYVKQNKKSLHLFGLVSDGGVHSSQDHLHHLLDVAKKNDLENVFVHAFTDGRDTDPKSAYGFVEQLLAHLKTSTGKLASVMGRYYAMDRDKRWERIKIAYDGLVNGMGNKSTDALQAITNSYNENVTDEFLKPIILTNADHSPVATIKEGDAIICFNFRTDRCREITTVLTQKDFPEFGMKTIPLFYTTMTNYDHSFKNIHIIYDKDDLEMTMGEVVSKANLKQIRISETEKYPHVTFFFSGGREKEFTGETRIMIPSKKVATYDLDPTMSANEVTDAIVPQLDPETSGGNPDFVCLNFANADMVGHTGVYPAIVKAIETVDACLKRVVEAGIKNNYSFIIIADHGNADYAINPDGTPNTAHSLNPVPCILIDSHFKKIKNGRLADLAPTLLTLMGIEIPKEMTGEILV